MVTNTFTNGTAADAVEVNTNFTDVENLAMKGTAQNAYQTLHANNIFDNNYFLAADEFTDSTGTNNTFNATSSTAVFSTDHYEMGNYFVEIEASAVVTGDFEINNCAITNVSSGVWRVYCYENVSYEVRRAQVIKTLFYGTDGSDSALSTTTSVTALKTSDDRDVGKFGYHVTAGIGAGGGNWTIRATFTGTTGLTNSIWTYTKISAGDDVNAVKGFNGAALYSISDTNTPIDEVGTDTTGDEADSPTSIGTSTMEGGASEISASRYLVLSEATALTWITTGTPTVTEVDFNATHSIPAFTTLSVTSEQVVCDTGVKTLDGTESLICVYADITLPTNTTITVDISDGTTTLSGQALNSPIGLSTLTAASDLELTFNLSTTNTAVTPEITGYGVYII